MNKKVLIAIIVVLVLVTAGAGTWFMLSKRTAGVAGTGTSALPISSKCKYDDKDLCKFLNNWKVNKYFTATATTTVKGQTTKSVIKSIGEDKTQFISYDESNKENMNYITIGNTTYTKDYSDNKWTKYTSKPTELDKSDPTDIIDTDVENVEDKTTYTKIGMEACGKLNCFKYQVIDPEVTDSTSFILFDNKEYQLRKTIDTSKDGTESISVFSFDKISIDVPSPVKESSDPVNGQLTDEQVKDLTNQIQRQTEQASQETTTDTSTETTTEVTPDMTSETFSETTE